MDAITDITQSLELMAAQAARLSRLSIRGSAPRALADGTGQIVWQADTYAPASASPEATSARAYAPGSGPT